MKLAHKILTLAITLSPALAYAQPGDGRQARRVPQNNAAPTAPSKRNFQGIAPNSSGQANVGNLNNNSDFFKQGNPGGAVSGGGVQGNPGGGGRVIGNPGSIASSGGGGGIPRQQSNLQNLPPQNFSSGGSQFNQQQFQQQQFNQSQFNQQQFNQSQQLNQQQQFRQSQASARQVQPNDLPSFNPNFNQNGIQLPQGSGGQRLPQSSGQGVPRVNQSQQFQQQQVLPADLPQDNFGNSNLANNPPQFQSSARLNQPIQGQPLQGQALQGQALQGQQFSSQGQAFNQPVPRTSTPFSAPQPQQFVEQDFNQFHSQSLSNYDYDPHQGWVPTYSNLPIQIVCPDGPGGHCHYELINAIGESFPYDINSGEAQVFDETTDWLIRYETAPGGAWQTYRLRGGLRYTLRLNSQGLWQLYTGT